MHLFASRYGWTKQNVLALPAFDFLGYLTAILEEEEFKAKEEQRLSAFTGWQFYTILKQTGFLGNSKLIKFNEYLGNLGLLTERESEQLALYKKYKREQNKHEAKANIQQAEEIAALVRRQKLQT